MTDTQYKRTLILRTNSSEENINLELVTKTAFFPIGKKRIPYFSLMKIWTIAVVIPPSLVLLLGLLLGLVGLLLYVVYWLVIIFIFIAVTIGLFGGG